jgi:hypothetical protein
MTPARVDVREPTSAARRGHRQKPAGDALVPLGEGVAWLAAPFDALRFQYASAVMVGVVQRSLLASGKLERALDTLEKLMLGPLARQR